MSSVKSKISELRQQQLNGEEIDDKDIYDLLKNPEIQDHLQKHISAEAELKNTLSTIAEEKGTNIAVGVLLHIFVETLQVYERNEDSVFFQILDALKIGIKRCNCDVEITYNGEMGE